MSLSHTPADVVRFLAIDLGLGTDPLNRDAWPVYVDMEPDEPDAIITVNNATGILLGRSNPDGDQPQHYGIQVGVRGVTSVLAQAKARAIETAFNNSVRQSQVTIQDEVGTGDTSYLVHSLRQTSSIINLGREVENSNRFLATINYTVVVTQQ